MQGGNPLAGHQHNDVLAVEPVDEEQRDKLVKEIKRRANAAFKVGSLREAEMLYSRAIVICKDNSMKMTLLSNRSMTNSKLGVFDKAKADAEEYIALDDNASKAHYRKAVALRGMKQFSTALDCFKRALELEPKNKIIAKEIELTKTAFESFKIQKAKREKEDAEIAKVKNITVSKRIVDPSKGPVSAKPTKKSNKSNKSDVDLSMRGYRTLEDGRKTTFFNMERTEEEKKLIGENVPVKLSDTSQNQEPTKIAADGASAWNQKGTFEEKDYTDWARDRMQELILKNCCVSVVKLINGNEYEITIKAEAKFKEFEGNASKTFTRKKFRRIFDFNFKIPLLVTAKDTATGLNKLDIKLAYFVPDFNGDVVNNNEEIEIQLHWQGREKAGDFLSVISENVAPTGSLPKKAREALLEWFSEFNKL